jgi:amphi-Trp domain-containing protein
MAKRATKGSKATRAKKTTRKKTAAKRGTRDVERNYPRRQFVAKLRRLADAIENGEPFRISIGGERVYISPKAIINVEHERGTAEEEVEFQLTWPVETGER